MVAGFDRNTQYLEAAVGGRAQALVSGDKDLLVLKKIDEIPIFSPRAFLQSVEK